MVLVRGLEPRSNSCMPLTARQCAHCTAASKSPVVKVAAAAFFWAFALFCFLKQFIPYYTVERGYGSYACNPVSVCLLPLVAEGSITGTVDLHV